MTANTVILCIMPNQRAVVVADLKPGGQPDPSMAPSAKQRVGPQQLPDPAKSSS